MARHRTSPARTLLPLVTSNVAGAAMIGAGLFMAGGHASPPNSPAVKLASAQCDLTQALCVAGELPGVAASKSASKVAAASVGDHVFSFFVGNGTAEHPNAGILVGDGFSFTADDVGGPNCTEGSPCNGGNAGLLFGSGGNGYDGGTGGNAYLYGRGGNGGSAVDFGLLGEDNDGGNGGNSGFLGGTDAAGNLFQGSAGNGGNGISGGKGGNGGSAGFFGISRAGNAGKGGNGGNGTASIPDGGNGRNGGQEALLPHL